MAVSIHLVLFNIIYIMRTKVMICGFCRPGLIHGFSPAASHAGAGCSHAAELIRFSTDHKPPVFAGGLLLPGVCVAQQYHDACAENL
ncbi:MULTISPECIES: hypothetical protein [Serratia]|uniref:hypothetical protein n=2 Tax=Serratia TaxID=613 RepID=UPI001F14BE6A|nr:hypothetical protein [Serratia marcescens]